MIFSKKTNPRTDKFRKNVSSERLAKLSGLAEPKTAVSMLTWLVFTASCSAVLSFESLGEGNSIKFLCQSAIVTLLAVMMSLYIYHYQKRLLKNNVRLVALAGLFIVFAMATKIGIILTGQLYWTTATATAAAIILTIAYNQRFAIGISFFYCFFAYFAANALGRFDLFVIMVASVLTCCFSLREIRTRMKLLEVSALAAAVVFITSVAINFLTNGSSSREIILESGLHAGAAFFVGLLIQSLLPLIEKIFKIATSMTLLDYTDANQPLLKRLAMEAPGTFSHCLLVGSIAEAAAEAIGRNGLLCRVGAYYHDIGKINKPKYFIENAGGSLSKHKELSPTMSQLVIIGHVKDGIELAKEYGLPAVIRQFVETHHGTTLVEYFYNEARKQAGDRYAQISEAEFRYGGPKPRTKEAAIVMLADTIEGAVRALSEMTLAKIEMVVHNMAMKRLQDGQFDECDLSLSELSKIEAALVKALSAHYHGRISYPQRPDKPAHEQKYALDNLNDDDNGQ